VAAPIWNIDIHHVQTNFTPSGTAMYWFGLANVGDSASSGPVSVAIRLPRGVRGDSVVNVSRAGAGTWNCPNVSGSTDVTCETTDPIPRHSLSRSLALTVSVAPWAAGEGFATANASGGGAAVAAVAHELTRVDPSPAGFGVVPGSFVADSYEADELTPVREPGAHPPLTAFAFDLNSIAAPTESAPSQKVPAANIRNFRVALPPGFYGDPGAVGTCAPGQLTTGACPTASQVGRVYLAALLLPPFSLYSLPVFNMSAPREALADLAFSIGGNPIHIRFSLDPANGYAVTAIASDLNETVPLFDLRLILWGVPADHSHDSERCGGQSIETDFECSTAATPKPFLTLPSRCGVAGTMTIRRYDSWQQSGAFGPDVSYDPPGQVTGCDRPSFEPKLEVEPAGKQANTPTGLDLHFVVPQNDDPTGLATPPLKEVEVTLPDGWRVSPSAADGLTACSPEQIGLGTDDPVQCPDSSRIGSVSVSSPLLPDPAEGSIYVASPGKNPFGSLFAIYLVARDTDNRGVLLKLPGRLDLDPATGEIAASFDELPQLPFDELSLSFRGGPRAPLLSAPSCGPQAVRARLSSYARPENPVDLTDTYQVSEGDGGGPCPAAPRPFAPRLVAGTLKPAAGVASPFVLRLTRGDSEQQLGALSTILPPGLTAKIAGIPLCPEPAIASIAPVEGVGQSERERPSCPPASRIGIASIGAGAGSEPIYLSGDVYLAGPYRGAPLSILAVVPALAGPFDLGTVVVRSAVYVDPTTARLRVVTDPLPTILSGVPLGIRSLAIRLDRAGLTLNPTSCEGMKVAGTATSSAGTTAAVSERFQVGNCGALGFKPRLAVRFGGATGRNGHPTVTALIRPRAGGANLRSASLLLPRGEYFDQRHIRDVCTRTNFAARNCPADSVYGRVKAWSSLLDRPLEGSLYMREGSHRLPDLVADLRGRFDLIVAARLDTPHARLRVSFDRLPDVPFSRLQLVLSGGRRGVLVNSEGLCAGARRAIAAFAAQNGKIHGFRPRVGVACGREAGGPERSGGS
jgi:hypothetical protein